MTERIDTKARVAMAAIVRTGEQSAEQIAERSYAIAQAMERKRGRLVMERQEEREAVRQLEELATSSRTWLKKGLRFQRRSLLQRLRELGGF